MERAVKDFGRAFSSSDISEGTLERLKVAVLSGSSRGKGDGAWLSYVSSAGQADLDALERLAERFEVIWKAIAMTVAEIRRDPYAKRTLSLTDGKAIGAVQGCWHVWKHCKGKAPPKHIKETSPFAKFLTDVMKACGYDDPKPVSAFNAWVRESQKSTDQP